MDLDTGEMIDGLDTVVDHDVSSYYCYTSCPIDNQAALQYHCYCKQQCWFCHILCQNYSNTCVIQLILAGTHDIVAVTVLTENNTTTITIQYFEQSNASGALYVLVFVTDDGVIDFTRSVLLALNKETSRDYTLPCLLEDTEYLCMMLDRMEHSQVV